MPPDQKSALLSWIKYSLSQSLSISNFVSFVIIVQKKKTYLLMRFHTEWWLVSERLISSLNTGHIPWCESIEYFQNYLVLNYFHH